MLKVIALVFNGFQENTYVLIDETNFCLVVDPGMNSEKEEKLFDDYIQANNISPQAIVLTHAHIDHILGCKYCVEKYKIPFYAHKNEIPLITGAVQYGSMFGLQVSPPPLPNNFLADGDSLKFGATELQIFHVPGHSPGSIALYSQTNNIVLTGDVLFKSSIGRTDLPGGDYDTLISSIRNKLMVLPKNTKVFPGHGPGTTIEEEIESNPFLL